MPASTQLPAIPHVSRQLTVRIARAYGYSPIEARRWFRRPCDELDGQVPACLASTIEGTQALVEFLESKADKRMGL
jgi:Protein of unknown function (DUF2384)